MVVHTLPAGRRSSLMAASPAWASCRAATGPASALCTLLTSHPVQVLHNALWAHAADGVDACCCEEGDPGAKPKNRICATCRAFHQGSGGRIMLSGGNDAQIIMWDWAASLPGDSPWRMSADGHSEGSGAVKVIRHGRKVHYIASRPDGALNTFVADTSCSIKAYNLV